MTLVAPKSQLRDPWQYTGQPHSEWPTWVQNACTLLPDGEVFLERRSGQQILHATEWLLRNLDERDPEWVTDAEYRRDYGGAG